MKTLEEVMGRCFIDENEHWLWRGSVRAEGRANIYGPDYTNGGMKVQHGPRAVWHMAYQQPIPAGHRVFLMCDEPACCNPKHMKCLSEATYAAHLKRTGVRRGVTARILANRATGRKRAALTPDQVLYVQTSSKNGIDLAAELGVSDATISSYRRGQKVCVRPAAGFFTGLM